jgi:hypothetical protein
MPVRPRETARGGEKEHIQPSGSKKVLSWEANFEKGTELGALLGASFRTMG